MKTKFFLFIVLLVCSFVYGCNFGDKFSQKDQENYDETENILEKAEVAAPSSIVADTKINKKTIGVVSQLKNEEKKVERKIIYSANIKIEVADFAKNVDEVKKIAKQNSGHIGSNTIEKTLQKTRIAQIVLRIPPNKFDAVISKIKSLGEVLSESQQGQDITKEFYDLEARLNNAKKFEVRILKLLETKTAKIKDVLEVERELSRIRESIETMQGDLRYYSNLVGLATISLEIQEKGVNLPSRINILQPIIDTFSEAFTAFSVSLGAIIILLFGIVPWLILGIAIIYIAIVLFARFRRKK